MEVAHKPKMLECPSAQAPKDDVQSARTILNVYFFSYVSLKFVISSSVTKSCLHYNFKKLCIPP